MSKNIITVDNVKEALDIESFRNLSKDKIMEFVSLIPYMDKEVAISIVNQFPRYAEMAANMIQCMGNICEKALESNNTSQKETIESYQLILNSLAKLLEKDNITQEERYSITEKMIEVADKIATKDTEGKSFVNGVLRFGSSLICTSLLAGEVILGVKAKGNNIPKIKK